MLPRSKQNSQPMTENEPSESEPDRLASRLEALEQTAIRAGRSLQTARRAMEDIADLCDVAVPPDPAADDYDEARTAAARAEVSLDAAADELERIAAALRATANQPGNDEADADGETGP